MQQQGEPSSAEEVHGEPPGAVHALEKAEQSGSGMFSIFDEGLLLVLASTVIIDAQFRKINIILIVSRRPFL
jgi:hypothetical protein